MVKWSGYSASQNTWEPETSFLDERVLHEYQEKKQKQAGVVKNKPVQLNTLSECRIQIEPLEVEKVVKVNITYSKDLLATIKYAGVDKFAMIPIEQAHAICPQLLIKYYEEKSVWGDQM